MAEYYVSNSGDDNNPGTQAQPWSTLSKVNAFFFSPGDIVYFKCGDTWRGSLYPLSGTVNGDVTYTSYGEGEKPTILGSVSKSDPSDWTDLGGNIWQTEATLTPAPMPPNLIIEDSWHFHTEGTADSWVEIDSTEFYYPDSSSFKISCLEPGDVMSDIQIYNAPFTIEKWRVYKLTFAVKSTKPFTIPSIELMLIEPPYTQFGVYYPTNINVTTDWQEFTLVFYIETDGIDSTRLQIALGTDSATGTGLKEYSISYIDRNVSLEDTKKLYSDNYNFFKYPTVEATQTDDSDCYYPNSSSMRIDVTTPVDGLYSIQVYNGIYTLKRGRVYKVTFAAKSTIPFTIPEIITSRYEGDYSYNCAPDTVTDVTTEWQEFTAFLLMDRMETDGSRFQMNLGLEDEKGIPAGAVFYLDKNITFVEIEDFEFYGLDIGNTIFENDSWGTKKMSADELTSQNDFYSDTANKAVKMYSTVNPASAHSKIELCKRLDVIKAYSVEYTTIDGLKILYSGAHGIKLQQSHHITVKNNTIGWIGGSILYGNERYGNGVEVWNNGHDILVQNNYIYQVYDAGITNQGTAGGQEQYNIYYYNNKIDLCEMSFETWLLQPNSLMHDMYFKYNTCTNAGYGWSHDQRPDPNGCHLLFYENNATVNDTYIQHNTFDTATNELISGDRDNIKYYFINYNTYTGTTENLYWAWGWPDPHTISEYPFYIEAFKKDLDSSFNGRKYRPLFPVLSCIEYPIRLEMTEYPVRLEMTEYPLLLEHVNYTVLLNCIEYFVRMEVIRLPERGSTVTLRGTFPSDAGTLTELENVTVKIYYEKTLYKTIEGDDVAEISTGVYEADFTIPDDYEGEFVYEFSGELGTRTLKGRGYFNAVWEGR